ncbi:MAG: isoleucine--tRNA ligase, partial [Bacteroidia bacterium]|nr:isoleucine--tRNA ligase [Bacteroidia bacterium]
MVQESEKIYPSLKQLDFPSIEREVLAFWEKESVFQKSLSYRANAPTFTFYEGPPSANGNPGIHHVMARTIKDIFCRYKTMKGFLVRRKGGWDTHGLPVELQVEKSLGISKADIGTKISIAEYNQKCREDVMMFKDKWDDLTRKMGYWLDLEHPYITFDNDYIESVWHILKVLFDKNFLYKGYNIQPYSPAAGTGLSSHELNLPGCYKVVKDISVIAMFRKTGKENEYFLAWTTTPWTLPANSALAVGKAIEYVTIETLNPYNDEKIFVTLAKKLVSKYFLPEVENLPLDDKPKGMPWSGKKVPWRIVSECLGSDLAGQQYEQLFPYIQPQGQAFRVILGDFVSTEDGTGIVHIAPTFGSDDFRVAKQNQIPAITTPSGEPIVDKEGKYVPEMGEFAGRYVKNYKDDPNYISIDEDLCKLLKERGQAFKIEKYEHNYPHCWRTDKPVLYYPLDSWFIRTTAVRDRMIELNQTINWKPESTGTGRFGNWLENLVDWNLSRSRYWGIPLPVWTSADGEHLCIGSVAELKAMGYWLRGEFQSELSALELVNRGILVPISVDETIDLHKPFVDEIVLVLDGKCYFREPDLIDVWFDSGAMPYAQWHYPFENQDNFEQSFPADFIAEGVDQTRGWFFTLHAIAVMLKDSVAFKNVIANGLVLDKFGNKMSKRLGNAIEPFETIETYGADPLRWYMIENAPPWENLKFNIDGVSEAQRKLFGTLFNTYSFFEIYANIDQYRYDPVMATNIDTRSELDRWILSCLHSLISEVDAAYSDYDPTRAARAIQEFVTEQLSNWYVRLSRRRFWKGEMNDDKRAAYDTLYECLTTIFQLMAPIAPFFTDYLYRALVPSSTLVSVHLTDFPQANPNYRNAELEARMRVTL